jgi:hypothetical protein
MWPRRCRIRSSVGSVFWRGLPPLDAVAATMTATVTAIDNLGYTLEAGTVFGLRATGDQVYLFTVDNDVVIAPGSTATAVGGVALTAQEAGRRVEHAGDAGHGADRPGRPDVAVAGYCCDGHGRVGRRGCGG